MQRTIIALTGIPNSGKTTTIKMVFEKLKNEWKCIHSRRGSVEFTPGILEVDGVKIGVASKGDYSWILKDFLEFLINEGCAVIVCSTQLRGSITAEVVEAESQEHDYDIEWIEKYRATDQLLSNQESAAEVVEKVTKAVENAKFVEALEPAPESHTQDWPQSIHAGSVSEAPVGDRIG
jgi:hypothetical protein